MSKTDEADRAVASTSGRSPDGEAGGPPPRRWPEGIGGGSWKLVIPLVALVLAGIAIFAPEFFQTQNLVNVSRQGAIIGVVAVGMTVVILTGGIDLSVGSTLALSTVTVATLADAGWPILATAAAAMAVGMAGGAVNGIGVAVLGIQPFVMTLATMVAVRGLALRVTNGGPRLFRSESPLLEFFGAGRLFGIPGPFLVFLLLVLGGWFLLRYTSFGRYIYAVGGSAEAARLSAVPIRWTLLGAYVLSGALAGIGGFMTAARLSVGDPSGGSLLELDAIAAVVIGGTSLAGGVGGMGGTLIGTLLLALVSNVMNLMGVSPFDQYIAKGALIVAAVLLGAQAAKRRARTPRNQPLTGTGRTDADR